ncbi:RluA family pseudouridine synthase [Sporomusa sphaeroides]|uniref:Pseudouridine synthase n=1 Tax=Sporomusa sphaeroides DSM 2875 TaxID=1337886 RepID=A0ABM9W4L8_9FIRM|nr:RluA family pseudouridine synthase [Sporomusa sphaeroides]OLS58605.1 ribosomal large subunit pseudouridine synthase D [Sporomusa sphaeroides DSM 2875]CVK19885.1 Ribosomal large subunit pseudouridine synthase D [Sporomusa sphaeroides DSM 2875]
MEQIPTTGGAETRIETISDEQGLRIDVLLAKRFPELSRSHLQKLIADDLVTVNGKLIKANYKVQAEDSIRIIFPEAKPVEIAAEAIPLDILYEDADIIVINKSRGMVVHPAAGNYAGTLVNALLEHCQDLSGINGEIRPGIVHRLDKDTSGVMVAAKNDRAHIALAEQIKNRTASRKYVAIVHGTIAEEQGIINAPIGRHPSDRKKMAVTFSNSKEAITRFRVIERFINYTLVECKLQTGRTHQIRVHMQYIGHPVVGDPKYGPEKKRFAISGQALHSAELSLKHPISGEELLFTAPVPPDMADILTKLKALKRETNY